MKKIFKILAISLAVLVGIFLLVVGVLNLAKFAIYSEYYSIESTVCKNPGLWDGFVCQGICVSEEKGVVLVSGYMNNGNNSRVYISKLDGGSHYVELFCDGKDYTGHAGGIALTGDTVYISNASRLFVFSLDELLSCKPEGNMDIGSGVEVGNVASFVYADEEYVYVGEYNDPKGTQKEHIYETPNGKNHAIIERYSHADLSAPDRVYSIIDYVQGVCFTPNGDIIFSTSYGLTSTVYYIYSQSDLSDSGLTYRDAPVYFLGECVRKCEGPAMGEDIDWYDGKVITLTESASNKYIFGKFFFAYDIVTLDFYKE